MTNTVNSTPATRTEDSCALQPHIAANNKGPNKWTVIGGGAFAGMITALAIGLIFGPIAAIVCFCVASITSTLHAAYVAKQCKNAASISSQNVNLDPDSTKAVIKARKQLDYMERTKTW